MRMTGRIEKLKETYGFVKGPDGVSRMFIPSYLCSIADYDVLKVGMVIEFTPIEHERGPRAINVEVAGAAEETKD